MDSILVLVLIGWALARMSKKNKKTRAKTVESKKRKTAAQRAEPLAQFRAEVDKKKDQIVSESVKQISEGEGISSGEPFFRGSMQLESTEGECICDPELQHEREKSIEVVDFHKEEPAQGRLMDFSASGIMQGFVMNEILTRPSQRARRR